MINKIRLGVILMLIGIAIPSVLWFFQKDGELFKLTIDYVDKKGGLRATEIETLNSILILSGRLKVPYLMHGLDAFMSKKSSFSINEFADIELLKEALLRTRKDVDSLIENADAFRLVEENEKEGKFINEVEARKLSATGTAHIPYSYSIGIGILFLLLGLGFVIVPLIGSKTKYLAGKTKNREESGVTVKEVDGIK